MAEDKESFDFWYAVRNTRVVRMPERSLETFGTTVLKYHLVTELMDSVNRVRVREGSITAGRPQILTPTMAADALENFGPEAHEYLDWLRRHENSLRILQYGFSIRKNESSEHIVSESLETVVDQVQRAVAQAKEPLACVLVGVDKPWEVCLLKLLRDVVTHSAPSNLQDFLQDERDRESRVRDELERDFLLAAADRARLRPLGDKLRRLGLFEAYEDRFFTLVKSHR